MNKNLLGKINFKFQIFGLAVFFLVTGLWSLVTFTSPLLAQTTNPKLQPDSKTEKRLKSMQQYRTSLEKYKSVKDAKVQQVLAISTKLLDEGISSALDCVVQTDTDSKAECIIFVRKTLAKVEVSYRLVKYYAILAGVPTTCVKADLGVTPHIKAHGITTISAKDQALIDAGTPNPKETGQSELSRVFLCSGNDSKPGAVDIKWRVQSDDGNYLRIIPADTEKLGLVLDANKLPLTKYVAGARKEIGI